MNMNSGKWERKKKIIQYISTAYNVVVSVKYAEL